MEALLEVLFRLVLYLPLCLLNHLLSDTLVVSFYVTLVMLVTKSYSKLLWLPRVTWKRVVVSSYSLHKCVLIESDCRSENVRGFAEPRKQN